MPYHNLYLKQWVHLEHDNDNTIYTPWIANLIIKEHYRNKGYGKIVVTELIKLAQENMQVGDLMCIEAAPTKGNIPFYVKCGMKYKPENQEGVYIWLRK